MLLVPESFSSYGSHFILFTLLFKILILFIFSLKDPCFTEACWFLPNINMNQPSVYICSLPLELPSHLLPLSYPSRLLQTPV